MELTPKELLRKTKHDSAKNQTGFRNSGRTYKWHGHNPCVGSQTRKNENSPSKIRKIRLSIFLFEEQDLIPFHQRAGGKIPCAGNLGSWNIPPVRKERAVGLTWFLEVHRQDPVLILSEKPFIKTSRPGLAQSVEQLQDSVELLAWGRKAWLWCGTPQISKAYHLCKV